MSVSLAMNSIQKLDLIDRFRKQFSVEENKKLNLPQIVVVGDQSSGKSSILEAISGIKLPRGVDTVTKCPLIISMRHGNNENTRIKYKTNEYAINLSSTEKEISKIQKEVFKDQLTKEPINIFIESSKVPSLTVIDLPGIIKTATTGHTIESKQKTVEIAKFYMQQENTLILCVLPANQDISTTTTIDLAKECNKDKSRIIGVLTKIDKLDDKEIKMIPDILNNVKLPIDKGYYGLIVGDKFLECPEKDRDNFEEQKFQNLPTLSNNKQRLGLKNFVERLKTELAILIDMSLPFLKKNIDMFINETKSEMEEFSMKYETIEAQKRYAINKIGEIEKKTKAIAADGDGEIQQYPSMKSFFEHDDNLKHIHEYQTFLSLWNKIFEELYDNFNNTLKDNFTLRGAKYKDPKVLEDLIQLVPIERNSMFDNSKPFKMIIDSVLKRFQEITSQCLEKCCSIMEQMIQNELTSNIDEKFFALKEDIKECGLDILNKQKKDIKERLEFLFESEKSYFLQNKIGKSFDRKTSTPEITDVPALNPMKLTNSISDAQLLQRNVPAMTNSISKPVQRINSSPDTDEFEHGKKLKEKLEKYLNNVVQRLGDVIPNFIVLSLFKKFSKNLKESLLTLLTSDENLGHYFCISNADKIKNDQLKQRLSSLEQFKKELMEIKNNAD